MNELLIHHWADWTAYLLLATSLMGLWARQHIWACSTPFGLALAFGVLAGRIGTIGLSLILLASILTLWFYKAKLNTGLHVAVGVALFIVFAGLALHCLPGFNNLKLLDGIRLTPSAIPYSLYLGFDKSVVGLLIVGFGTPTLSRFEDLITIFRKTGPVMVGSIVVVVPSAYFLGYVHIEAKLPAISFIWFFCNLVFTCISEEALFRGFLQENLQRLFANIKRGGALALILASLVFGAAHFAGGWKYVLLASVAGFFYGYSYLRTGRIEAGILTHIFVNSFHFFFLTYPALLSAFQ